MRCLERMYNRVAFIPSFYPSLKSCGCIFMRFCKRFALVQGTTDYILEMVPKFDFFVAVVGPTERYSSDAGIWFVDLRCVEVVL